MSACSPVGKCFLFLLYFHLILVKIKADQDDDTTDDISFARQTENSEILINVNHVIDYLHSIKINQQEMFQRIESLSKSVESSEREEYKSKMKLTRKVSTLEVKVAELEGTLSSKIEEAVKHYLNARNPHENMPPPPRPSSAPESTLRIPMTNQGNFLMQSTMPPLPVQVPQMQSFSHINPRSSRDISYYEPPFRDVNHRPNYLRNPERSVADRQGYLSIQLLEESKHKMRVFNDTLEVLKNKILNMEQSIANYTGLNNGFGIGTIGNAFDQKSESELEEKLRTNSVEVLALRQKQSEMQRAIDSVLIHFSTIVLGLESADQKIEQTQRNLTALMEKHLANVNLNHNLGLSYEDQQLPPINGDFPLGAMDFDTLKIRNNRPTASALTQEQPQANPSVSNNKRQMKKRQGRMRQSESLEEASSNSKELSGVIGIVGNLSQELNTQKEQINQLSNELAKVNVSHLLLLRTIDEETLQRTIRPKDCSEIVLFRSNGTTGKYVIFPTVNEQPLEVICDLETDGGGWTLIQRRGHPLNHKEVRTDFFRNWTEYENGFGSIQQDFWIGLSNIAALSKLGDQELRIEMTKWNGDQAFASYKHFHVADSSNSYKLQVSGYSGTAGDSLARHNLMPFSTMDKDKDSDPQRNCAQMWKGAWWYYGCHESNLNGLYAEDGEKTNGSSDFGTGIIWYNLTGNYYSLKKVEIKIRNSFVVRRSS